MMYGTVRIKSLVWFATGVVVSLLATVIVMQAWRADAAPGDLDSTFVPITPCRLVDTRQPGQTLWTHGETRTVDAHGTNFECTLPSEAVGLSMNVTALDATTVGTFLTIWPDGQLQPNASSLNPSPGQPPTPNAVTTPVSSAGKFNVFNFSGTVGLIIDVNGYYTKATLQEIAMQLADKADRSDVYTKAEIDAALAGAVTLDVEVVETPIREITSGGGFLDAANCPVGKTVMGGGYRQVRQTTGIIFNPDIDEALIFSVSTKSPNGESWLVAVSNETLSDRYFVTTAICASVNP